MLVDLLDVSILGVEGRCRKMITLHVEWRRVVVRCSECAVLALVTGARRLLQHQQLRPTESVNGPY
jgi:hypothetical protein